MLYSEIKRSKQMDFYMWMNTEYITYSKQKNTTCFFFKLIKLKSIPSLHRDLVEFIG